MRQANSYTADAVPTDVKLAAERRFGAALRMFTPRENGGPYRGRYSIPSITLFRGGTTQRGVSCEGKDDIRVGPVAVDGRAPSLNGADVQIVYEGERAKLYPWDRRDQRAGGCVAEKSAREMGFDGMDAKLDALHAASWARVKAARAAALASQVTSGRAWRRR